VRHSSTFPSIPFPFPSYSFPLSLRVLADVTKLKLPKPLPLRQLRRLLQPPHDALVHAQVFDGGIDGSESFTDKVRVERAQRVASGPGIVRVDETEVEEGGFAVVDVGTASG
jgi:hypothetical protein